jgi:membrane-bound metal-dependent hydrolase YbcI (DUF457 family)
MFLGHFGLAMAAARVAPGASLGTTVLAAQLADGLWPVFMLLGLEQVRIAPGITRVTPLDFVHYPYTHSLLADAGWAALFAALYGSLRKDWRTAGWLAALVLSHWVLDALSHRPDMPLWPGGPKVGAGLWNFTVPTLVVEYGLFVAGAWLYLRATRALDRLGTWLFAAFTLTLAGLYLASVLGPPPPSARALAFTGLAGWLFVAWGYWIGRHRAAAIAAP